MAPSIVMTIVAFVPFFLKWLLGLRTSQAGDRSHAKGMRKTWSAKMALAVAFLKSYLRGAEAFTIEYCQARSRAIPFMTAPLGIGVKKIKIPAFPWRSKAETIVLACLSDQEKEALHGWGPNTTGMQQEADDCSQKTTDANANQEHRYQGDRYAEGLDAEWLEHRGHDEYGPETCTTDNATAVLYFHGGGYYTGSKEEHHQPISEELSLDSTTAGNDSDKRFQPHQIVLMGDSAGGGLALSLSLLLRDHGALPQPRGIVTWSPWLDLTSSLPSFKDNALTDIIPYEDFTHVYSEAVERMFEHHEDSAWEGDHDAVLSQPRSYQRAQIYCPDSCLRMKYVSPLYETNYRGIPSVFIMCGSAERFADECMLLAARLEKQQQPCRIDIFEDMPHVFPLFRFHPSAMAAFDRTAAYIRELVQTDLAAGPTASSRSGRGQVVIPISSPSISSPALSSFSQTPSPSPSPFQPNLVASSSLPSSDELICFKDEISNTAVEMTKMPRPFDQARTIDALSSPSSIKSDTSSTTTLASTTSFPNASLESSVHGKSLDILQPEPRFPSKRIPSFGLQEESVVDAWTTGVIMEETRPIPSTATTTTTTTTTVNVIDLSGTSVLSYHNKQSQTTPGPRAPLLGNQESQQRRRRRQKALRIQDVVSEATLYEWENLLTQGSIPTRRWQLPPHRS
ncbi:hypothetical protein BGZ75_005799 [Mortierella antarctica]|nr:hypothetical protein BGZ75_005799 [Mortierella antarctica]